MSTSLVMLPPSVKEWARIQPVHVYMSLKEVMQINGIEFGLDNAILVKAALKECGWKCKRVDGQDIWRRTEMEVQ